MRRFLTILALVACNAKSIDPESVTSGSRLATEDFRVDADVADLSSATLMLVTDEGQIFIPQSKDRLIKVIGADGSVSTIGRAGGGPGEFSRLIRIGSLGDSIWALDPGLNRVTIFGPDLKLLRSFPQPLSLAGPVDAGLPDSSSYELFHQAVLPGGALRVLVHFRSSGRLPRWPSAVDSGAGLHLRVSPSGTVESVLGVAPIESCYVTYTIPNGLGGSRRPICDQSIATDWDGGDAVASSTTTHAESGSFYLVRLVDDRGTTVFERQITFDPIPVPPGAADSAMAGVRKAQEGMPKSIREAIPAMDPDPTFPPVRRLVLGRDGGVWVEEETRLPGHHWRYLDPTGEPRFTVTLPASVRLLAADSARVWGTDEDEDGLLSVVGFRLSPAPRRP